MSTKSPKVSIGLLVYNGENFVREAIESILGQTFEDFELIISDNASTDRTEEICRTYAAEDKRVRYFRNHKNVGISANFTKVFELSSGKYFKWAAHDDSCQPNFLLKCVQVLDQDPSVVLSYARAIDIDAQGKLERKLDAKPELGSSTPHRRFRAALGLTELFQLWGLIRADILKRTPLLGNYVANDGPFLSGLSLFGRFYEIPEFLFLHRQHEKRSGLVYSWRDPHRSIVVYDPLQVGKIIFPEWRLLAEHIAGINRAPLNWHERVRCYFEVFRWLKPRKQNLLRDLMVAGQHVYGVGPVFGLIYKRYGCGSFATTLKSIDIG